YPVYLVHCSEIERIGSQSVERIGRNSDDTALDEEMRRISQRIVFRALRVHAQQLCQQLFGLWRRRSCHPAALRRAAIIWATLPHAASPCNAHTREHFVQCPSNSVNAANLL